MGGNDTFTVDFTNGEFELPGGLNLVGNVGTDTVTVLAESFTNVVHTATDADSGSLFYDDAGPTADDHLRHDGIAAGHQRQHDRQPDA